MSHIGKKPINIPEGVEVNIANINQIKVKGKLGELSGTFHPELIITKEEIDYFTTCFDNLLEKDLFNLLTKFVTANVKDLIPK